MKSSRSRPLVFSLLLATVLAVGVSYAWIIAAGWVITIARQFLNHPQPNENLVFTADGEPLIQSTNFSTTGATVMRTLDGKTLEPLDNVQIQYGSGWLPTTEIRESQRARGTRNNWRTRITGYIEPSGAPNFWYLVTNGQDPARAYFEGFDAKARTGVGFVGLRGFRTDEPPLDEQFEIESSMYWGWGTVAGQNGDQGQQPYGYGWTGGRPAMIFLQCMGTVYRIDLRTREVKSLMVDAPVIAVGNVTKPVRVADQSDLIYKQQLAARLADRMLILDESGVTLRTLPLPEATRDRMLGIFQTVGDEAIVVAFADRDHEMTEMYWLNSAGGVVRHESVPRIGGYFIDYDEPVWHAAICAPSPLVMAFGTFTSPNDGIRSGRFHDYPTALAHVLQRSWLWLAAVAVLAAALSVVCFRRHVRCAQPHPAIWAFFVFLLGPAGLIGYLVHRNWPAMSRCARCGATVPQDRLECAACAAEFALPARRGIEIFA